MLARDPEANARLFAEWAHAYVQEVAEAWRTSGRTEFHIHRERAWQTVLRRHLAASPAAFFATEPQEPRYRAAFHAALTAAVVSQADSIAAAGDQDTTNYDSVMKDALARLISKADGFDDATIAALRILRRRNPQGSFSLLGLP